MTANSIHPAQPNGRPTLASVLLPVGRRPSDQFLFASHPWWSNDGEMHIFSKFGKPNVTGGIEIRSLGLLPTGSKMLAEVRRPFGCAGCINYAVTSGQIWDV